MFPKGKKKPSNPKVNALPPQHSGAQPSHLHGRFQLHGDNGQNNFASLKPPSRGSRAPSRAGAPARTLAESQSHLSSHENFDLLRGYENLIWFANHTDEEDHDDRIVEEGTPESSEGDIIEDMEVARGYGISFE